MKISIAILIIALAVIVWHLRAEDKKKKAEAIQIEAVATQHRPSVGGKWIDVEEVKF